MGGIVEMYYLVLKGMVVRRCGKRFGDAILGNVDDGVSKSSFVDNGKARCLQYSTPSFYI
jgi:hypothetical protein